MEQARDDAFQQLMESRSPQLLKTAFLLTGDWGRAEDLLQTALAKTWTRWPGLRDPDNAEGYVRRVLVTTYAKWWRRRWRGEVPTGAVPVTTAADPYTAVEERDALRRALAGLSARQRTVLVLRYYEDLSEQQVADLLGCPAGTVKSTASRALAAIRHLDLLDTPPPSSGSVAQLAWEQQP